MSGKAQPIDDSNAPRGNRPADGARHASPGEAFAGIFGPGNGALSNASQNDAADFLGLAEEIDTELAPAASADAQPELNAPAAEASQEAELFGEFGAVEVADTLEQGGLEEPQAAIPALDAPQAGPRRKRKVPVFVIGGFAFGLLAAVGFTVFDRGSNPEQESAPLAQAPATAKLPSKRSTSAASEEPAHDTEANSAELGERVEEFERSAESAFFETQPTLEELASSVDAENLDLPIAPPEAFAEFEPAAEPSFLLTPAGAPLSEQPLTPASQDIVLWGVAPRAAESVPEPLADAAQVEPQELPGLEAPDSNPRGGRWDGVGSARYRPHSAVAVDSAPTTPVEGQAGLGAEPQAAANSAPAPELPPVAAVAPAPVADRVQRTEAAPAPTAEPASNADLTVIWQAETVPFDRLGSTAKVFTPAVGTVRVTTDTGEIFEGNLQALGKERVWLKTSTGELALAGARVKSIERMQGASGQTPAEVAKAQPGERVRARTQGGGWIYGKLVASEGARVVLITDTGARITLDNATVESANKASGVVIKP